MALAVESSSLIPDRGRAGVVGVPAGGWPCSHRPCSCSSSSRNIQRPPAWWQRSSTSAAAAASSSGSSESSSSFTTLRPKPNIPQIWLLGFLNTCIYIYLIFSSYSYYNRLESDLFKVNMGLEPTRSHDSEHTQPLPKPATNMHHALLTFISWS